MENRTHTHTKSCSNACKTRRMRAKYSAPNNCVPMIGRIFRARRQEPTILPQRELKQHNNNHYSERTQSTRHPAPYTLHRVIIDVNSTRFSVDRKTHQPNEYKYIFSVEKPSPTTEINCSKAQKNRFLGTGNYTIHTPNP